MRKLTIAAAIASTVVATAANARDGSPYVGIDFGLVKPQATPLRFTDNTDSLANGLKLYHKYGFEGDFVFGYDFGMLRLEAEAAYKRASLKNAQIALTAAEAVGNPNLTGRIPASGHNTVGSGMINALLDVGGPRISGSFGAGFGYARVRYNTDMTPSSALAFRDDDAAFAYQFLAEVRMPVSDNIDVGLKYKYFAT